MDWGKAKNIFIIAFLILNLSLGYQLYLKNFNQLEDIQATNSDIEEISEKLKQQEIAINIEIPKEMPEMHFLQVKNKVYANNSILKNSNNNDTEIDSLHMIIYESVTNFEQYKFSEQESNNDNYFVYYQYEGTFPFYGSKLEVFINEDGTIYYTQNYYEIVNQGLDRQVISSYSALQTILDQQLIPSGAEIIQIKLGYHGQTSQSSIQLLTPVWKISYSLNGIENELFVNAMTGGLQNVNDY